MCKMEILGQISKFPQVPDTSTDISKFQSLFNKIIIKNFKEFYFFWKVDAKTNGFYNNTYLKVQHGQ